MKSKRSKLREKILQVLYAYDMHGAGLSDIISSQLAEISLPEDKEFCTKLINLAVANRKEI